MTATEWPSTSRLSSGINMRPSAGWTSSVEKYSPETSCPDASSKPESDASLDCSDATRLIAAKRAPGTASPNR
jgi:hypothetical protein